MQQFFDEHWFQMVISFLGVLAIPFAYQVQRRLSRIEGILETVSKIFLDEPDKLVAAFKKRQPRRKAK
jgi:hypothetical protein